MPAAAAGIRRGRTSRLSRSPRLAPRRPARRGLGRPAGAVPRARPVRARGHARTGPGPAGPDGAGAYARCARRGRGCRGRPGSTGPGQWSGAGWPRRLVNRLVGGLAGRVDCRARSPAAGSCSGVPAVRVGPVADAVEALAAAGDGYRTLDGWLARLALTGRIGQHRRPLEPSVVAALLEEEETVAAGARVTIEQVAGLRRCRALRVRLGDLRGSTRRQTIVAPRHLAISLARTVTGQSYRAIGSYFGRRDSATVRHACRAAAERLAADPALAAVAKASRRRWQRDRRIQGIRGLDRIYLRLPEFAAGTHDKSPNLVSRKPAGRGRAFSRTHWGIRSIGQQRPAEIICDVPIGHRPSICAYLAPFAPLSQGGAPGRRPARPTPRAGGLRAPPGPRHLHKKALTVNGRTLWDNAKDAVNYNEAVITPIKKPFKPHGGIAVLRGNLAPKGAVIKPSAATPKLLKHRGRAVVFENIEDLHLRIDDPKLKVDATSILCTQELRTQGLSGLSGSRQLCAARETSEKGVTDMIHILSDARMSGTAYGTVVLHTAPEAAAGGPLALVQNGDLIELDVAKRRLQLHVSEPEAPTPPQVVGRRSRRMPTAAGSGFIVRPSRRPTRASTSTSWSANQARRWARSAIEFRPKPSAYSPRIVDVLTAIEHAHAMLEFIRIGRFRQVAFTTFALCLDNVVLSQSRNFVSTFMTRPSLHRRFRQLTGAGHGYDRRLPRRTSPGAPRRQSFVFWRTPAPTPQPCAQLAKRRRRGPLLATFRKTGHRRAIRGK